MISIILAAGSGTRMRPISYYIPKILLPVKGRPVLDYLLKNMDSLEIERHYIVASEHLETIERYIQNISMDNIEVIRGLGWETGGDLSLALEQIDTVDDALVMNGDIVTDLDYSDIWKAHQDNDGYATIGIFMLNDPESAKRFGQIKMDSTNKITRFNEKSASTFSGGNMVNTGFYIFDRKLIAERGKYLVPRKFKVEDNLFPRLSSEGRLYGSLNKINYWWDVGTMESYIKTEKFLINSEGIVPPE